MSSDGVRVEMRGNEGWDLAAPVVSDGTTTALIFKREKKETLDYRRRELWLAYQHPYSPVADRNTGVWPVAMRCSIHLW